MEGEVIKVYANDHASMCSQYARDLFYELNVRPVMSFAYTGEDNERRIVYCHPDDENKDDVKNFEYPHREI
ncbi:MAG: hypothetical protein ACOCT9_02205 [archaeon]